MTDRFNVLAQQLFQKNIDDCSVEELESLAREYPYFAPAQYVLLSRLKNTDYNSYQAQLQKAILYYHDPLAFDHFLDGQQYTVDFTELPLEEVLLPTQSEEQDTIRHDLVTNDGEQEEVTDSENPAEEIIDHQTLVVEIPDSDIATETNLNIEEGVVHEETPHEEILPKPVLEKEATNPDTALAFEPYHTIDYFASQGIKLSQEEASRDKFGKQLRSFTEWLKTMKKLPAAEQVKSLDTRSEEKVEDLAAHSVEGQEVYTETMAEVWTQQGNKAKAIEVYNKLSLLNPSKRAYFAAKIDSLK